jgi:undecaprenyl-diphosphatase
MDNLASFVERSAEFFMDYGIWGLILISFMESSFFPIPPDVVLIPLALLNPGMALWYALATTVASVLGGVFGYYIGCKAGRPILCRFVRPEKIHKIDDMLCRYGGWAVAIAGFTPIPYKVFTIAAGVSRINMTTFILASFLGRGGRFFLEGLIITALGAKAGEFLDKYMEAGTVVITVMLALAFLAYKYRGRIKIGSVIEVISGKKAK